mmetsp:Transcript_1565/g.5372  ORF Transcript_1565/g.5372 Transcript_1565/m.5372 type:complete len:533 (-) Transcript_1565:71-1669(-)|eukprot:CAMPEP_0118910288 /NCGR_PEP_ID=MMETSP1166-20130328/12495_1 /TAXON_ID=1104430 /ORGANISM="Chrysoreinhardia sp, Strain CCMP3193" /LENGTH=532 /DNA_ID=CAMNT_0006849749 /DNA_START=44 /DNA_END=1642 /DNA_ORIENTATION=-
MAQTLQVKVALLLYALLSMALTLSFKRVFGIVKYPCALMAVLLTIEAIVIHFTLWMRSFYRKEDDEEQKDGTSRWLLVAISLCVAGELGLSNEGLARMSVASHTMIKACTPLFVLMASLGLGLETPSVRVAGIVALISLGTLLCSLGKPPAHSTSLSSSSHSGVEASEGNAAQRSQQLGLLLTVAAGAASGVRWALTQLLTQNRGTKPRFLVANTLPIAAVALAIFSYAVEYPQMRRDDVQSGQVFGSQKNEATTLGVYASLLAFLGLGLLWTEVTLVAATSSLSLAILATAKETALVVVSIFALGDPVTGLSALGFLVTVVGILAFHVHKNLGKDVTAFQKNPRVTSYLQLTTADLDDLDDDHLQDLDDEERALKRGSSERGDKDLRAAAAASARKDRLEAEADVAAIMERVLSSSGEQRPPQRPFSLLPPKKKRQKPTKKTHKNPASPAGSATDEGAPLLLSDDDFRPPSSSLEKSSSSHRAAPDDDDESDKRCDHQDLLGANNMPPPVSGDDDEVPSPRRRSSSSLTSL